MQCASLPPQLQHGYGQEIQILKEFRDGDLLTNPPGQACIDFNYEISSPIAASITDHPCLNPIARVEPSLAVAMSAIIGLLTLVSVALAVWATKRQGRGA